MSNKNIDLPSIFQYLDSLTSEARVAVVGAIEALYGLSQSGYGQYPKIQGLEGPVASQYTGEPVYRALDSGRVYPVLGNHPPQYMGVADPRGYNPQACPGMSMPPRGYYDPRTGHSRQPQFPFGPESGPNAYPNPAYGWGGQPQQPKPYVTEPQHHTPPGEGPNPYTFSNPKGVSNTAGWTIRPTGLNMDVKVSPVEEWTLCTWSRALNITMDNGKTIPPIGDILDVHTRPAFLNHIKTHIPVVGVRQIWAMYEGRQRVIDVDTGHVMEFVDDCQCWLVPLEIVKEEAPEAATYNKKVATYGPMLTLGLFSQFYSELNGVVDLKTLGTDERNIKRYISGKIPGKVTFYKHLRNFISMGGSCSIEDDQLVMRLEQ